MHCMISMQKSLRDILRQFLRKARLLIFYIVTLIFSREDIR